MAKKVLGIVGSYRKNHIIDSAVSQVLEAAKSQGAETSKIFLLDKHIEFCTNCRMCTQQKDTGTRGECPIEDDMSGILDQIDAADALVLGSPVNMGTVTAVTKRFLERLVCYAYWPWESPMPKMRVKNQEKKALTITSSACPASIARLIMRSPLKELKAMANCLGAKVTGTLYLGTIAKSQDQALDEKTLRKCQNAGQNLVS